MERRLLFSLDAREPVRAYRISQLSAIPEGTKRIRAPQGPSLLVVRNLEASHELSVGVVRSDEIEMFVEGPDNLTLVVEIPEDQMNKEVVSSERKTSFVDCCADHSKGMERLAEGVVRGLLEIEPALDLVENSSGRWINNGVNFVTLKPQPRKANLQFTVYGNPGKFEDINFVRQDQNSYSRGWISDPDDLKRFLAIARHSYRLRTKS